MQVTVVWSPGPRQVREWVVQLPEGATVVLDAGDRATLKADSFLPLTMAAVFHAPGDATGFPQYGRFSNPTWDASQGVASNLLANVSQFRQRGKEMIQHRRSAESLRAAMDPNYGYQRLADQFAGRYHDPATPTESLLFESAP